MNIMVISRGYPTEKYKMNGIFEWDQAKALAKAGQKVSFAAVDVRSIRRWRKWGIERHYEEGVFIYVINLPGGRLPYFIMDKLRVLGLKVLYKKIVKEQGKPDIFHAHFYDVGLSATVLKCKTKTPLVITEHSSHINKKNIAPHIKENALKAYKEADRLIAVSPSFVHSIKSNFHINAHYIPNIVDIDVFKARKMNEKDKFHIVSTGSLVPLKRMDLTIEAFKNIFFDYPTVMLTIFGEGPERKKIENLIKEYGLQDRVLLKGMCSREIIAETLRDAHLFVLASQKETFGVAYIEALASGVPVIATKCGGPESFVNEYNGILVEVNHVRELEKAMKYMYEHIDFYDRDQIAKETKSNFAPQEIAKKLIEEYENVLKNKDI